MRTIACDAIKKCDIIEQTTLRDRKNMLGRSQNLRRHKDKIYEVFERANVIRDRVVHPYPAMSTDAAKFWDFEESQPMANEPLDEGLDRPPYELWPELLQMKNLRDVHITVQQLHEVIRLLDVP